MVINRKRIRNIERHVIGLAEGEEFYIATIDDGQLNKKLKKVGFTNELHDGEKLLPKIVGPITRFNSEGGYLLLRELPKETCHRVRIWEWKDWGGNSHSKTVYIPYERYQRKKIPAPSEEITLINNDAAIAISRELVFRSEDFLKIKHTINVFLEIFGSCQILKKDLTPVLKSKVTRLNWEVLPPGKYPWETTKAVASKALHGKSPHTTSVINDRLKALYNKGMRLHAIGTAGFHGYMIFEYMLSKKKMYVLESVQLGNATYVLDENWATIAKLSKAEILDDNLHEDRIIHNEHWLNQINNL